MFVEMTIFKSLPLGVIRISRARASGVEKFAGISPIAQLGMFIVTRCEFDSLKTFVIGLVENVNEIRVTPLKLLTW
jgi:hypothetical protein